MVHSFLGRIEVPPLEPQKIGSNGLVKTKVVVFPEGEK
jgi:hypothetical protein